MEAKALALIASKGGTPIGAVFLDNKIKKVRVRCKSGHEWAPRLANLVCSDSWCPECHGNKPLTLDAIRTIVETRGGKLLSAEYRGLRNKLSVECSVGHQWEVTPNNLKNHGSWCPSCKINVGEELTRAALVEAFPGFTFERTRSIPWMLGKELDGAEEELGLAFEYQGKQHGERVEFFQPNDGDHEAQLARDKAKEELCDSNWVTLLRVPHTVKFIAIRAYIRSWLEELGYAPAKAELSDAEFYDSVRANGTTQQRQYARICAIIKAKGGEAVSTRYVGYRVPMQIRCQAGHTFSATPEAIDQPAHRGPRFCPDCGGKKKLTGDILTERVQKQGWGFVKVESKPVGTRKRRTVTAICPAGVHLRTVSPDEVGTKLGKCRACG